MDLKPVTQFFHKSLDDTITNWKVKSVSEWVGFNVPPDTV